MTFSPNIAAVVIAGGKRGKLIEEQILPSLQGWDEIVVAGEYKNGEGYRYLNVPAMTQSTNDALVKRDIGTVAVRSDVVLYLSDDHAVHPSFASELRQFIREGIAAWDVLVPSRWADHPEQGRIQIPNGEKELYCGGHGGVFRRRVIQDRPWTAQKHHRNWDLIASHEQQARGFKFLSFPRLMILDLEPENSPWA